MAAEKRTDGLDCSQSCSAMKKLCHRCRRAVVPFESKRVYKGKARIGKEDGDWGISDDT